MTVEYHSDLYTRSPTKEEGCTCTYKYVSKTTGFFVKKNGNPYHDYVIYNSFNESTYNHILNSINKETAQDYFNDTHELERSGCPLCKEWFENSIYNC
tara:strand:- start:1835 stop:2128 length:294 start_codon:yes stop_codon:yes gene_type:complete